MRYRGRGLKLLHPTACTRLLVPAHPKSIVDFLVSVHKKAPLIAGLFICQTKAMVTDYRAISLRFLRGRTLTATEAGLALNMVSSPVKGLIPLRALVAGFLTV